MNGHPIASHPIAYAGLRQLATEEGGPRPGGVRAPEVAATDPERRTARAARP